MKKILSLLLAFLMVVSNAYAITGVPDNLHWVPAGFGGAGTYSMIVPSNFTQNKIYGIPDVNSPYVSTDKGENWTFLAYSSSASNGFGASQTGVFVQSKNDANLMYAMDSYTSGGLYRSTNGGANWTKVANYRGTKGRKMIAIDPTNDNKVYVGTTTGIVAASSDGGTTWSTLFTPFGSNKAVTFIYVNPTGTKLFVGGGSNGFVVYDIAGGTSTAITLTGTNAVRQNDFDTFVDGSSVENLCVTAGYKVACTADEGANWTYTAAVTTGTTYYMNKLAVHRKSNSSIVYVITRILVSNGGQAVTQYSTDSGTTWATSTFTKDLVNNPTGIYTSGNNSITSIYDDPFDETIFYLATDWRMYRSDNSGGTFVEKVKGAQNIVATDIAIAPNGRKFQTSMDTGIQRSDDNGATWTQCVPNATQPYVTGSSNDYGGHYWRVLTLGTEAEWNAGTGVVIATATMYSSPTSLYFTNWVIRSTDSGVTWSRSNSGFPTVGLYGDIVWDHGYIRALGKSHDESTIYVGMDGENCDGDGPGGLPYNCTTNMATGGLFMSTDKGLTWSKVWASPRKIYNAIAVDPTDSTNRKLLFGTFGYNLYQKTGTSTANYVGDASGPGNYIYDVAYDSVGRPYAVTTNSGPRIYKSVITSYGNGTGSYGTWQLMHNFGSQGILDGIVIDPNNNNRIFVSITLGTPDARKIYVTTDAQNHNTSTWYDITGDFPVVGGCQSLAIDPDEGTQGFIYCASNGGGLYKLDMADSPTINTGTMCIGCST